MAKYRKTLRIKGDKELIRTLNRIKNESPIALGAALYQEGQEIMSDSKENYVPVDLSTLKTSGHVELPEIKSTSITVTMGYGGAASEYALAVHETPSRYDPPSWRGKTVHFNVGGPKYLEIPLNTAARTMAGRLAKRASAFLKKFGK